MIYLQSIIAMANTAVELYNLSAIN